MVPDPTTWSMTSFETPDAAAPMIADTFWFNSFGTVVAYALLSGSPESPSVNSTLTPRLAALMSFTARSTPAS